MAVAHKEGSIHSGFWLRSLKVPYALSAGSSILGVNDFSHSCDTFKLASFSHLPSSPVSLFSSIGRWPCLQIHKKRATTGHTFSQFFNSLPSLSSSPTLHLVNLQVHWKLDALLLHFLLLCQEWATCFPGSDFFFLCPVPGSQGELNTCLWNQIKVHFSRPYSPYHFPRSCMFSSRVIAEFLFTRLLFPLVVERRLSISDSQHLST